MIKEFAVISKKNKKKITKFASGGAEGAEIVYSLKNDDTLATMALNNIGDAGQVKRKVYQRRLPENPNKDYYYILRETGNVEPILVEYGFIDNVKDANKLRNNIEDYVEGVVKAIADYTGYQYTPPGLGNQTATYIVRKGDTLYKIANMFNLSVQELKELNNLTSDTLTIGQVLKISTDSNNYPSLPTTTYTVKRGDTLYAIATRYEITVDELKRLNNLTSNTLYIGQELQVPKTSLDTPPEDIPSNDEEFFLYEVKKGDSLWLIAQKNNVTVDELIKLNNLNSTVLQIGDVLKIPGSNPEVSPPTPSNIYIVKAGDTLWSIARENDLTVDELKKLNNLTSNLLSVGQTLFLS